MRIDDFIYAGSVVVVGLFLFVCSQLVMSNLIYAGII